LQLFKGLIRRNQHFFALACYLANQKNHPGYHRGGMFVPPHFIFPKQLGERRSAGAHAHELGIEIDYSIPQELFVIIRLSTLDFENVVL
jgi:hypothetical protein